MKKIKFIIMDIFQTVHDDFKGGYDSFARPKELLKIWFYLMIIFIVTGKLWQFEVVVVLYILTYIWRVVRQGRWKHNMRESYLK